GLKPQACRPGGDVDLDDGRIRRAAIDVDLFDAIEVLTGSRGMVGELIGRRRLGGSGLSPAGTVVIRNDSDLAKGRPIDRAIVLEVVCAREVGSLPQQFDIPPTGMPRKGQPR